ncbi:MAG: hypothetical protein CMM47_00600 [Rhodospirillaceae bacterium]|nr:hypothetical protein [Rhodospirillaceae bacterium]MBM84508.1 hypothetical protein [Rhodospirillaceae bacterium]
MDRNTKIVVELLSKSSLRPVDIADMFDVSESAIANIASQYSTEIANAKATKSVTDMAMDARLENLEATLLNQIEAKAPFETDLRVLAGLYKVINGATRRVEKQQGPATATASIVLNQRFVQNNITFSKDSAGRVVQVADNKLQTASADHVREMASQLLLEADTTTTVTPDEEIDESDFN